MSSQDRGPASEENLRLCLRNMDFTGSLQEIKRLGEIATEVDYLSKALGYALSEQKMGMVVFLVGCGANVNYHGLGATPLMIAASNVDDNAILFLLMDGAKVNLTDPHGETALLYAVREESVRTEEKLSYRLNCVKALLEAGADVMVTTQFGHTAFKMACDAGWLSIAKLLLDYGSPIDQPACSGRTPLISACLRADHAVVEFLVHHGANVTLTDQFGRTALLEIVDYYDPHEYEVLFDDHLHEEDMGLFPSWEWRCHHEYLSRKQPIIETLGRKGVGVGTDVGTNVDPDTNLLNIATHAGTTPLQLAKHYQHTHVCELLFRVFTSATHPVQ